MLQLYKNIKKLRIEKGMSQEELAAKTGYSDRTSIAKIESGRVDLPQSKIKLFAEAFGVDPVDLLGWDRELDNVTGAEVRRFEHAIAVLALQKGQSLTELIEELKEKGASEEEIKRIETSYLNSASIQLQELNKKPKIPRTLAAHFEGKEFSEEQLRKIGSFVDFVAQQGDDDD